MINGHVTVAIGWAWWANSRGPEFQAKKLKIIFLLQWVKLLTDLQIWGCELHKNAFDGRALRGPAGRTMALPSGHRCGPLLHV